MALPFAPTSAAHRPPPTTDLSLPEPPRFINPFRSGGPVRPSKMISTSSSASPVNALTDLLHSSFLTLPTNQYILGNLQIESSLLYK